MNQLSRAAEDLTPRGRATRQGLLDAAEAVIAEVGYDAASVAEITRRAGVAQGTFYIYFPDKKSIFTELVRHLNHKVRETSAKAVEGLEERHEIEREGFRAYFGMITGEPAIYRIIREAEFVDHDAYAAHYQALATPYAAGLREAMTAGDIAGDLDPAVLAYILMGIGEFMGMTLIDSEFTQTVDEVFEQVMCFIDRGLGRGGSE